MFLEICARQDMLCWIIKESNECGFDILYDTIFNELDDMGIHIHYRTDEAITKRKIFPTFP